MKVVLVIVLIALCALVGWGISDYYRRRRKFFEDLFRFNQNFRTCVQFSGDPLAKFVAESEQEARPDFRKVLERFSARLKSGDRSEFHFEDTPLTPEERAKLSRYFEELGSCDARTEREKCEAYRNEFQQTLDSVRAEEQRNSALSVKLGIYFGVLAAILII